MLCIYPRCQFQRSSVMYFYFANSSLLDTQVESSTAETMCESGYLLYAVLCGMRQLSSCAVLRSQPEAAKSCCIVLRMDVWYICCCSLGPSRLHRDSGMLRQQLTSYGGMAKIPRASLLIVCTFKGKNVDVAATL